MSGRPPEPGRGESAAACAAESASAIAEAHVAATRATASYAIGEAVLALGARPLRPLGPLRRLIGLARAQLRRERGGPPTPPAAADDDPAPLAADLLLSRATPDEAVAAIAQRAPDPARRAALALSAARAAGRARPELGAALAREAAALSDAPETRIAAARALIDCGALSEPLAMLDALGADPGWARSARDAAALLRDGPAIPSPAIRAAPRRSGEAARIGYVAALTRPHHLSGYAARTHEALRAWRAAGREVICFSRPGYPWDRRDAQGAEAAAMRVEIDGTPYIRSGCAQPVSGPLGAYLEAAARALEHGFRAERVAMVAAGSNHVNALPALIAARRLGLPFLYDVRGLWEETEATRRVGWAETERYAMIVRLETALACEADAVTAISDGLAARLAARGVPAERIARAPNGVDAARFAPDPARAPDPAIARAIGRAPGETVFGFVGSMERYEGLDLAVRAMARAPDPAALRLVAVGDGPGARAVWEAACAAGLQARVRLVGRVAPEAVPDWLAACDVALYPRRDHPVCRIVPAMKPLEAMAAGLPVILSDLPALRDLVGGPAHAVLVPPEDEAALAAAMARLAADPAARAALGATGREFATRARSWEAAVAPFEAAARALT